MIPPLRRAATLTPPHSASHHAPLRVTVMFSTGTPVSSDSAVATRSGMVLIIFSFQVRPGPEVRAGQVGVVSSCCGGRRRRPGCRRRRRSSHPRSPRAPVWWSLRR
nr:MAG TPA: hypothetical protein [Caudoviricetes sp.]